MRTIRDLADISLVESSALSIGVFDGVHIGHRYLVNKLMESARGKGFLSGVVTFDIHPDSVLAPQRDIRYLTTLEEKLTLLDELGLDFAVVLPFNSELAQTSARDFVLSLMRRLCMRELWVGPDFALGRDRQGNAAYLRTLGQELGFRLETLRPLLHEGEIISSTNIRALLREGRVAEAGRLLGRCPAVKGTVTRGASRGQQLGFPTANLTVDERVLIPGNGIYAARVRWGTANHQGVVNIGVRPTFEDRGERVVEAHVLDFKGDLYGQTLEIEFMKRLRSEQRFDTAEELIAQMKEDIAQTRLLLDEQ